jgi:uncharacterized BrkB/YihY/UPF0761 family membrane protein
MISLYYRIWTDCIKRAKQQPANRENWPVGTMISMTLAMAFNLVLIMTLSEKFVFNTYFYKIDFSVFPSRVNNVLSYLILFILPCFILNYLLIFRNKRYEKVLTRYPYYNGKLFAVYFVISMMLPIMLLIGAIFLEV